MNKVFHKVGFTLVEVLIALTLSGMLLTILVSTFFDTYVFSQEMAVRTSLLSDSKILLDTMAQEIREGKVDFEEYFQQCVVDDGTGRHCPNDSSALSSVDSFDTYGQDHGLYEWQFFDGGVYFDSGGVERVDGVGALCQKPDGSGGFDVVRVPNAECVSGSLSYSEDFNTGVFDGELASSICSSNYMQLSNDTPLGEPQPMTPETGNGSCSIAGLNSNVFDELYLLNEDETRKIIYAREQISDGGYAVSKLELVADASASSGGIELVDYVCADSYNCTEANGDMVDRTDLNSKDPGEDILNNFVPVTPLKVTVEDLKFIINPMEDASKAYGEFSSEAQVPPRVTILMTLKASPDFFVFGLSDDYELKIQRTVVASVD